MKRLIFLLAIIPAFAFGQAPDYDYTVTPTIDGQDTTYTLEICDRSNVEDVWKQCKRQEGLTIEQVQTYFYTEKERILNQKGGRVAAIFVNNQFLAKLTNAVNATGGDYAAWSQGVAASQGTFSGIYQYNVIGGGVNLEIRIEGINVFNNDNNNQIGNLTGELSRQWLNITTGVDTYTLTSFDGSNFYGVSGNNIIALRKTGDLQQP